MISSTRAGPRESAVLHTWCVQSEWNAPDVVGGHGAWLVCSDGREILDMSSLAECSTLGHQHPRVVEALVAQAKSLCFVNSAWGAAPRAELAQRLLALSGFEGGRVLFTLGGADANENAVKLARWFTGRHEGRIVARERSYHGASFAAMTLSGDARTRALPPSLPNVVHVAPPYCYRCPWGLTRPSCGIRCADAVREAVALGAADARGVSAIVMEPHAGTNGIVPPPEYWPELRGIATEYDALLIADEVMSAFGRVGEWFAWQRHGDAGRPDIVTLAKGLTGAHAPLGAVVLAPHVAAHFEHRMLQTGLTYSGHPLCCAAGLAAVEAYAEEGLIDRSRAIGRRLEERLQRMARSHPSIGDIRGAGAFFVLEFVADRASRTPLAPWPETPASLRELVARALDAKVSFAIRGHLLLLAPPLTITDAEIDHALDVLDRLLAQCVERPVHHGAPS